MLLPFLKKKKMKNHSFTFSMKRKSFIHTFSKVKVCCTIANSRAISDISINTSRV